MPKKDNSRLDLNHPANIVREIRAEMFREYHFNNNKANAITAVQNSAKALLEPKDYYKIVSGLTAELEFYILYGKEMDLDPSLDYGNHVDFVGKYADGIARIDVTTNQDYKKMEDYLHYVDKGEKRFVALKENPSKFWIISMNFPLCPEGDGGRLFDIVLLGDVGGTHKTPFEGSLTQYVVRACSVEPQYHHKFLATYQGFGSAPFYVSEHLKESMGDEYDSYSNSEIKKMEQAEIDSIVDDYVRFFRKKVSPNVVILAEDEFYFVTNPSDYDGFTGTKVWWIENVIRNSISEDDYANVLF